MSNAVPGRYVISTSSDWPPTFTAADEDANRYRPGGLHPVAVGEVYESSCARYKIIHKLGWGAYSTVWLASVLDQQGKPLRQYRALKFRQANVSGLGFERAMLRKVAASSSAHPGRQYTVRLFDDFDFCGPNGKHEVFVMEVTGPTLESLMNRCWDCQPHQRAPLPPPLVRRFARQLLLALEFLASEGVIHGDLYPSNVTLAVTFLDGRAEDEVVQLFGPLGTGDVACRKPRMARFIGVSVPEKLIYPGSLSNKFIDSGRVLDDNLDLRLVDFGQAVSRDSLAHYSLHTPDNFRAPELYLCDRPCHKNPFAVDVWAAGCIIYKMVTTQPLFSYDGTTAFVITMKIGGTRPSFWPESEWANCDDESIASDITTLDDGSAFSDFLRQLLVLDPEQRPAVPLAALRAHAWFSPSTPLGPGDDAWRQAMRHEQSNSQVSLAGDTDDGAAADAAAAAVAPAAPKQRGWVRGSWRQCMCHIL